MQLQLEPDHLKLEPDHVLAQMLDAMHLIVTEEQAAFEPEGGAWKARKEVFAAGKPFSVTDAVIRPQDGHMYVTIGGRGGQSALYRISYQGKESTAPVAWFDATPEQKLRRELEALRDVAPSAAALDKAWPLMGEPPSRAPGTRGTSA